MTAINQARSTTKLYGWTDPTLNFSTSAHSNAPEANDVYSNRLEVNQVVLYAERLPDSVVRLQKTEYALVSSLERDPLLAERIRRLRTVPGVGPITALTWALEIGDVSRFPRSRQAISYCGLCGDEKSSADNVMRTPLSKQRNKHIQRVLGEAAKLAPRQDHDLALVYETTKQKGNANRATLAVARKMVAYLLAVDRGQRDFVPAEAHRSAAA